MEPHPHGPDGPPPPYTETDIYSYSQRSRSEQLGGVDDDLSIAPSSSHSNCIDTPPESPSDTQYNFAWPDDSQPPAGSAQAYFDARPPNQSLSPEGITIGFEIRPDAVPSEFPYPALIHNHDVSTQDWQTFINYLLPDHAKRSNSHIIDRKREATGDSKSPIGDDSVEAQFASLSTPETAPNGPQNIETVLREWNDGFFGPRGITILNALTTEPTADRQVPRDGPSQEAEREAGPSQGQPQRSGWWRNPFEFLDSNNGSLRVGPIHIEGDRVALGSTFEVDSDGVRWRGQSNEQPFFEASSRGVRWGEQPGHGPPHSHPFGHFGHPGHPWSEPHGGRGRGRGRGGHGPGHRGRDHSASSAGSSSSSSSTSSSDSDSSVGSLPDWDDLKDTQLPVTKLSVQAWLSHPDQPITKNMVKQAKAEIKAAKRAQPLPNDPSRDQAREALRREVKDLLQQVKTLKRQQRTAQRTARKEKRQQKRAAKQERREGRRNEKRERRATRRAERDADRHARRFRHHHNHPDPHPHPPGHPEPPMPSGFPFAPPAFGGETPGFYAGSPFGPRPPPPPGFGFGRGFGRGGRGREEGGFFGPRPDHGRGRGRGWGPGFGHHHHHQQSAAERTREEALAQAERTREAALAEAERAREAAFAQAAAARSAAEKAREEALAQAFREREKATSVCQSIREQVAEAVARSRSAGLSAAMQSRESVDRARAHTLAAEEESRRAAAEATGRAAVTSKLAEARALEAQIETKAERVSALEARVADDERRGSGSGEKGPDRGRRVDDLRAIERLEVEMERLGRRVETLKIEADEALARSLAEQGDSWEDWK